MAKIVLRNDIDGARRKIIARFKSDMTHAFIGTTSTITVGSTLNPTQANTVSSDTVIRLRELQFTSSATVFQTVNDFTQTDNDSEITLFYLLNGRPVNKLVLIKPEGSPNVVVRGIITFPTVSPSSNQPYYIDEIKIEVLDQV